MRNETRQLYNAYLAQVASLNGVPLATEKFTVDPTIQQTLENKIQESSAFLSLINIVGVDEQEAEKLGLGIGSPIASRTDTTAGDRQTKDPSELSAQRYRCEQTNSDTHLTYKRLDAWAKFADFQARVRDAILRRNALDRMMVGFNGTSVAVATNPVANPLLQDVNIGWLQHYRTQAPARVLSGGAVAGTIAIGGIAPDYANLDALVFDAVNNLIDPWHQDDTELVAIMGRDMLADKYFPLLNQAAPATEKLAADLIISQKRVGNLSAARVPFFPPGKILITRYDNLSIYFQEGARRRAITDNPKRDRVENWESSNDAFVVEDFGGGCLIENIVIS